MNPLHSFLFHLPEARKPGLRFDRFMQAALYHPEYGYYHEPRALGRQGDFYTSASVGPCYGFLLARQFRQLWDSWGKPDTFGLIEQGAHQGDLAADILDEWPEVSYHIIEPRAAYRQAISATLQSRGHAVTLHDTPRSLTLECGIFFANELLDAFPVRRFRWQQATWWEVYVNVWVDQLRESLAPISDAQFLAQLPVHLADGFTFEYCPAVSSWFAELSAALPAGAIFLIDYGLKREERFLPQRAGGTLRAYRHHKVQENPLEHPGEADLTWHIDFTQLEECALALGWEPWGFVNQSRFLTGIASPWLASLEGCPNHPYIPQFKTLTHPGLMGASFTVISFSRKIRREPLDGFRFAR